MPIIIEDGTSNSDLFSKIEQDYVICQRKDGIFELACENEVKDHIIPVDSYQKLIEKGLNLTEYD